MFCFNTSFFKAFLTKSSMETLSITLLFQCKFSPSSSGWKSGLTSLFFHRIVSTWRWINTKIFIGFSIPSACTQAFPGIRRELYSGILIYCMLIKYEEELYFFYIHQKEFLNTNTQRFISYNTNHARKSNIFIYNIC